ncbi:MAG: Type 1 glutamine amidotransferase-like domain-containing protein [Verrucomicrobia bacterium]|nr:Type 1 glutamine amidotransferase-like domain-containing protein [Verrucomicrobiota bacterium]
MKRISWFRLIGVALVLALGTGAAHAGGPKFQTSPQASVLVCGGSMMHGDEFSEGVIAVMREHYRGCRHIALVLHASLPGERDPMEGRLQRAFTHLLGDGVKVESLHRRDEAGAKALLAEADGLFVGGGETFVLLGELQRTGQLGLIRQRVLAGVPYGGSSAGANVAGLLIGTTNDFPTGEIVTRAALAVFPAVINPHHPLPDAAEYGGRVWKITTYLKFNPTETVCALSNAAIMRWHGGHATLAAGRGWIYRAGGVKEIAQGEDVTALLQ